MNLTALRFTVPALALALVATSAFAWSTRKVEGSGNARTETRAVSGFTSLSVSVPGDTEITQGSSESLSITADDNVLAEIETVVEGKVLKVRFKKGIDVHTKTKMKLALGVKTLESIAISGSGDVRSGPLQATALSVSISGSGDARFEKLEAKSLKVSVAGSGDFSAAGKVDSVSLSIAGSGNVKAAKLESKSVQLNVAGSGDAVVWASDTIKMRVVGSGGVKYYGNPTVDQTVVGSGSVKRLGAAPRLMLDWLRRRNPDRLVEIDPALWRQASAPWLFMRGLQASDAERLRALCEGFLARKHFSGTHDLEVTPAMQVEIAAQACILVLELGIEWYDGWSEVIVYPSQFAPEREEMDEDGVVHLTRDPMAGEAWLGGPVILSYEDVAMSGDASVRVAGYNVVIHEFAHKLDMRQGEPSGFPPLHAGMSVAAWRKAFSTAYEDFCARVDEADAVAEEDDGEALDALPIDPYAAESPAEFFAVISEAFFETPELLAPEYPGVYEQLRLFYRQDPLARLASPAAIERAGRT